MKKAIRHLRVVQQEPIMSLPHISDIYNQKVEIITYIKFELLDKYPTTKWVHKAKSKIENDCRKLVKELHKQTVKSFIKTPNDYKNPLHPSDLLNT